MKKFFALVVFLAWTFASAASEEKLDPSTEAAVKDYREFSKKLGVLTQQYQQLTGQIEGILKEEGVPVFDETTDSLRMEPYDKGLAQTESVNVVEKREKEMIVTLALPGLKRDSITVRVEDGKTLRVKGEKKIKSRWEKSIEREIPLPDPASEEGAVAKYEDGILTVTLLRSSKKEVSIPVQ